jgi:hypothetical protein
MSFLAAKIKMATHDEGLNVLFDGSTGRGIRNHLILSPFDRAHRVCQLSAFAAAKIKMAVLCGRASFDFDVTGLREPRASRFSSFIRHSKVLIEYDNPCHSHLLRSI